MVYARYIKRGGKRFGPYYYKSVRGKDNKISSVYVGSEEITLPHEKRCLIVFSIILVLLPIILLLRPQITGLFVFPESYEQELRLVVNESQIYTWNLEYHPLAFYLTSIKLSGNLIGEGSAKVFVSDGNSTYLILDTEELEKTDITGYAAKGKAKGKEKERDRDKEKDRGKDKEKKKSKEKGKVEEEAEIEEEIEEVEAIIFDKVCIETCKLPKNLFNGTSYELIIVIDNATLGLDEITYSLIDTTALEEEVDVIVLLQEPEVELDVQVKEKFELRKRKISRIQDIVLSDVADDFKVKHKYSTISALSGSATPAGIKKLKKNPNVKKVYPNKIMHIFLSDSVPIINASSVWQRQIAGTNITGASETVCVLDTGIDTNHTALSGAVVAEYCYCAVTDSGSGGCCPNAQAEDTNASDDHGHGTHVAGIVTSDDSTYKGVAPDASLVAIKVCNSAGSCGYNDIIAGIDWCVANASQYNISVISMSLGGGGPYSSACDADYPASATAVDNAIAQKMFVATASGNDGWTSGISWPACLSNATAIGSTDKSDNVASYTNREAILDLLAPGGISSDQIISTKLGGGFVGKYGTSMATPHVAGAAALMRQYQKLYNNLTLTPNEIRELLKRGGVSVFDSGTGITFPRIDVLAAINSIPKINMTENSVEDPENAKIIFEEGTDLSGISGAIIIDYNLVGLDSEKYPQFNVSANLTLYNLIFSKTPIVLRDGIYCPEPDCAVLSYSGGNFSFSVSSFTNYSAGSTSSLTIWDEGDSGMPFYDSKPKLNNNVSFYANYTNTSSRQPIGAAQCNITFTDATALMTFNSAKGVFEHIRNFTTTGSKSYNISCNHTDFETLNATDSIAIGTLDWIINGSREEVRTNEQIYIINGSVEVNDNSSLTLTNSTLIMSMASSNLYNLNVSENASLVIQGSLIKSESPAITFGSYIYGQSDMDKAILNASLLYLKGNKTHNIDNSTFYNDIQLESTAYFNNSVSYGEVKLYSDNFIVNSTFTNIVRIYTNSDNSIQNSSFSTIYLLGTNSSTNFTQAASNITSTIQSYNIQTLAGFVDMPANGSVVSGNLTRYYPVYVYYTGTSTPAPNKLVNITNATGSIVWQGYTDAGGYVEANLTLTSNNYGEGNFTISVNSSENISLLTDTPVDLNFTDSTAPTYSNEVTNPSSPTTYVINKNYQFNCTWQDDTALDEVKLEFDGQNYTITSNISGEFYNNFTNLAAGNYSYIWWASDKAGNWNSTPEQTYTIDKASSTVKLYLNGSRGDKTINKGDTINITAILTKGECDLKIEKNGSEIASGSSPVEKNEAFNTAGVYNITAICEETQNHTADSETHLLTVKEVAEVTEGEGAVGAPPPAAPVPTPQCIEQWRCEEWSNCTEGQQTRICKDTACDQPQRTETRSCCEENWTCEEWSECINGTQTRSCTDQNKCGTTFTKPIESRGCGIERLMPALKKISWLWLLIILALLIPILFFLLPKRREGKLERLIKKAEKAVKKKDLKKATALYKEIKKLYNKLPVKKKKKYHQRIMQLFDKIVQLKRKLKEKHIGSTFEHFEHKT